MDNNGCMFLFCFIWTLRCSATLPDCCHVTGIQGAINVTCSGCHLQAVPQDLPNNTTLLNLHNNNLNNLHRDSFPDLPLLQTLNLQSNKISRILSGTFDSVWSIEYLDLSVNNLDHLSMDQTIFASLNRLKTLNIHRNNFHLKKAYPENALSTLSQLECFSIDVFEGFSFGNGFLNLTQLKTLELMGIESVPFLNASFVGLKRSNISFLNIRARIRKIEKSFLSPFSILTTLRLDSIPNSISIHDVLQGLYGLRDRVMDLLRIHSFRHKFTGGVNLVKTDLTYLGSICVKNLYLTDNDIRSISIDAVVAWTSRKCVEVLDVSENKFYNAKMIYILPLFPSMTHLYCSYNSAKSRGQRNILDATERFLFLPKHLTYVNVTHNSLSGQMINVTFAKGNNLQKLDIGYSSRNLSCSYGQIKGLVHLKELDISGMDCSKPNSDMFAEVPNLTRLIATQSNLGKTLARNATSLFKGLYNLSTVDFSSNNLERLNIHTFSDQSESLKTLILAGNRVDRVSGLHLNHLSAIETIDLSNNLISTLRKSEYAILDDLKLKSEKLEIMLFGNPLTCSCDNLDFISWIETTHAIYNKNELICMTTGGNQLKFGKFLESFDEFQDSCVSQFWLIISVMLILVFFMLIILTREAWRRSVWLHVRCRQPLEHNIYQNDIFISYCDEDSDWITTTFVPRLQEKGIEYCIDEKSFPLGRDIADNIMDAIDNSYQTVFVVSCNFLQREWTTFAMKLASVYSFRDGREDMNIIILLNDIKRSEFPKLVRKNWDVIRPLRWPFESNTDQRNLITAEKKLFWQKLFKRIQRGNERFLSAPVSESTL